MNDRSPTGDRAAATWRRVTIQGGDSFRIDDGEDSLLRGALRAGIGMPHECSVGGCGACRFDLVSGHVATLWDAAPGLTARDRQRGKHLACQSFPLDDCTIRVRCDDAYRPPVAPRQRIATLLGRRDLTPEMSEIVLQVPGDATFLPGQYALLYPEHVTGARAYSMSNLPGADATWSFVIRRVAGGAGSVALLERYRPGDTLKVDGPYGHAYLRQDSGRDVVCIAGGSGLGPMLSIAGAAIARDSARRVRFFAGLRSQGDLGAVALVDALAAPRLATTVVLSSPEPGAPWAGASGLVHAEVERSLPAPLAQYDFYFAGPAPMIDAVQEMLMIRHKVPFEQIHYDRFT
ncbi:MAG TPA: 2Fe-2S iron-sulfur cluster-binding protein [Burkholderiaceae bacterium]|nr:2Fe-2S iron-sulfur cluster-binding protein [Burkholderiaceae bacterium]